MIRIFSEMVFFSFGKREKRKSSISSNSLTPSSSSSQITLTSGENGLVDK